MNQKQLQALLGELLDDETEIPMVEVCRACQAEEAFIAELVDHGLLNPSGGRRRDEWSFDVVGLRRIRTASRLRRDLNIDVASLALVIELLEELHELRERVQAYEMQMSK